MQLASLVATLSALAAIAAAYPSLRAMPNPSAFGDQDVWVFSRVWYPEICATTPGKALCATPPSYLGNHLVAGDLMPAYKDGSTQTGLCRYEYGTFRPANIAKVGQDKLAQYWPSPEATDASAMWSGGFDGNTPEYAWTCGGLHQGAYLQKIVDLTIALGTPSILSDHVGEAVDTAALREALTTASGAAPVLICHGDDLARVVTCYGKEHPDLHSTSDPSYGPTDAIACPPAWQKQDSCTGKTVHVTSF
ncbi:hypothetical protein SPRG_16136 [Saprolegnia parasitica CBS 223.65]|uniref:Uncharacterized protein n=1 Tax=Saprolegnia parasitica (strain CBS 223.65) TaxID=695850 RepID=A0A067BJC3_SAPPC|nr:hypothetical protein SPRG_16136 [Saprolegnia parasitica CBS 223.65]KDO18534.1 hypothetical protein SPRG_16136 [Saprolegnia parasitica CBS 223.65]|eukprot:XP_012210759.1 hypothetical protein SPRG_16136 [Saprolegnia parasitica CBS 223.65]